VRALHKLASAGAFFAIAGGYQAFVQASPSCSSAIDQCRAAGGDPYSWLDPCQCDQYLNKWCIVSCGDNTSPTAYWGETDCYYAGACT
jgi:hypothetical protein